MSHPRSAPSGARSRISFAARRLVSVLWIGALAALPGLVPAHALADDIECAFASSPVPVPVRVTSGEMVDMLVLDQEGPFSIEITPGPGLAANPAALAAFRRAAERWEQVILDPIVVNIDADFTSLGGNVVGRTGAVSLVTDFDPLIELLKADAADEAADAVVASLPTQAEADIALPQGVVLAGDLGITKANLKALGFDADPTFGRRDAEITFNSDLADRFDFDSRDGVTPGLLDFESVAAHEIGHALGFTSSVDAIDEGALPPGQEFAFTLDLFRFVEGDDPQSAGDFGVATRSLSPGGVAIYDDGEHELKLSTGRLGGDGRQASHWKDDNQTGVLLGLMDPSIRAGLNVPITAADLRALDLIGYEVSSAEAPPSITVSGPRRGVAPGDAVSLVSEIVDDDGLGFPIFEPLGLASRVDLLWSFPEGTTSTAPLTAFSRNPVVRFSLPDGASTTVFEAAVSGFDFLGDTSTTSVQVTVSPPPDVMLAANGSVVTSVEVQSGESVAFTTTVSDDDGLGFPVLASFGVDAPITYVWDFGGGAPRNGLQVFAPDPTVTFRGSPGDAFEVSVQVFDAVGVATAKSVRVVIVP